MGSVNPSIRLYHWTNESTTRKYFQYHAIIKPTYVNWSLEYISTAMLPGLSARHLNDLLTDISKQDSIHFDNFFNFHLSGRRHDHESCSVGSLCRCRFVCAMKNIDYQQFDSCLTTCTARFTPTLIIVISVLVSLLILGILAFLIFKIIRNRRPRNNKNEDNRETE